jgi:hypothetical protein
MLALISVWVGLANLLLAGGVTIAWLGGGVDRALSHWLTGGLYGSALGLTLAILSLWSNRKLKRTDPGVAAQRLQAKIAITLCLLAIGLLYTVALAGGTGD